MSVYLRLKSMDLWGTVSYSNLEVGINEGADGNKIGWFEIKGDNGVSDGGTWDWGRDEDNFVCIKMTSNKFKAIILHLRANDWGKGVVPPHQPYFKQNSAGGFQFFFPGYGKSIYGDWWFVKGLGIHE